jgi:predicted ribosomally synthesized peptide with nif11-like leader
MSATSLTSFLAEMQSKPALLAELRSLLPTPEAAIRWADEKGYRLTRNDVAHLADSDDALTDDDLDQVAGGEDGWGSTGQTGGTTGTGSGSGGTTGGGG